MTGEVKVGESCVGGMNEDIDVLESLLCIANELGPKALGLDVLNGRNDTVNAKGIGPCTTILSGEQVIAVRTGELVESGGGFAGENESHGACGVLGQFELGDGSAELT